MAESLRDRQKHLTEQAIVTALAEHVARAGSLDFTVADIADRAGVSARTIYNHFGDRQGLIDALSDHAGAEMDRRGGTEIPDSLPELPGLIATNFAAMEAVAPLAEVFARLDNAATAPAGHSLRTRLIIALVRRRYPHLTERQTEAIGVMIRQLASSALWYRLTREHGLTTEEAAAVAEWTMRLQVEALERGDHPLSGTGHDG